MANAGLTSELYTTNDANEKVPLGAPPTAPSPIPAAEPVVTKTTTQVEVVNQPVQTKTRMADEGPDGKIRDTSMEAIKPSNDLQFRNLTEEEDTARVAEIKKQQEAEAAKPAEIKPAEAKAPEQAPVEKVYAGKFKSTEELEKGYLEAEKRMHKAMEEKAALERAAQQAKVEAPKTPAQIAAEEAQKAQFLERFVKDPEGIIAEYQQRAAEQTVVMLAAQEVTSNWRKQNPDLTEAVEIEGMTFSGEDIVAAVAKKIAQSDAVTAANPDALISKSTALVRQYFGTIRNSGAKEALTQETRVIPLLKPTVTTSEQPSPQAKAPLTSDDAYALHLRMLKEEEARTHRGLNRR